MGYSTLMLQDGSAVLSIQSDSTLQIGGGAVASESLGYRIPFALVDSVEVVSTSRKEK